MPRNFRHRFASKEPSHPLLLIHLDHSSQTPCPEDTEKVPAAHKPWSSILLSDFSNPNPCTFMEIPPNTIFFFYPVFPVQPDLVVAPPAATTTGGCNHTLPSGAATHRINRPNRSVTAERVSIRPIVCTDVPREGLRVEIFVRLHFFQRNRCSELQHGRRLVAGRTSPGAWQVLLPPGKLQVKFVKSFWALSRFQPILTLTVLLDNFFPQLSHWKNSQLSNRYLKIHLIVSCTVN